ncbi:hypothetical protein ACT02R_33545, partial [Pseudomonas aeruginosa]|uniref:hypothetical protein n=1 Tax=Pseudomonas aeruginosa TaxID=287 RepID=UPI00402B8968
SVRISVESLSGCAWNGCPSQRGIRSVNAPSALGSVVRYVSEQHAISPDDYEIVDGTTVIEGQRNE